ncbi:MAG TPA: DUF3887 domain-containing protein [Anaerolineales bacterium]|nr:DUF3887 domain-containing protein [Anaerolineales bacterium]
MNAKFISLFVLVVISVLAAACGTPAAPQGEAVSALTPEEAENMIENALQAFNTGNYATWSHDWDDDMKAVIKEADFKTYRDQVVAVYGQYLSLESLEIQPGQQKGNVRWVAIANFEKGKIKFGFGFPSDGRLIKGVFPEAVE